jgi:tRNA G18 (ribose-2'-O)-methylase SpoU
MIEKILIESLDLPGLEAYRTMKWQFEQRAKGIFVAEGEKVVRRLLESNLTVISVLLPEKWFEDLAPMMRKRPEKVRAYVAEKKVLETLTGFSMYQGVLAEARVPEPATLDDILSRRLTGQPLVVAVEGVSSAENMGSLVRNCVAFGVDGLIVGETCCSPYLRRAVRSSMGTIFKLPLVESSALTGALAQLKTAGVRCVAAHPHSTQRRVDEADFRTPHCIVLGAEGTGLSAPLLDACDEAVVIPMQQEVDSLNVATAGAVFLYEAMRQRGFATAAAQDSPAAKFREHFGDLLKKYGVEHRGLIEFDGKNFTVHEQEFDFALVQEIANRARALNLRVRLL